MKLEKKGGGDDKAGESIIIKTPVRLSLASQTSPKTSRSSTYTMEFFSPP